MTKSILFLLLLAPLSLKAACLKLLDLKVAEGTKIVTERHVLMFAQDSCGGRGCEIELFSKDHGGCYKSSLREKGFLIPESLTESQVKISVKSVPTLFKFNGSRIKFEN